jgi:hypothetical protein
MANLILRGPDTPITQGLSELEKSLGVDLKINKDGDLELNNLNDIKLIAGVDNAAQAIFLKLNLEPGSLLYHPEIGTDLQVGSKTKNALDIKVQIIRSLSLDERFENVDAFIKVLGDVVLVDLKVSLANTGIEVPLQFAAAA